MMTVLRTLILVSNQGRLRLVRCTVDPGCHTERTIFAEQDAVVDMAYCTVTAAISSAVIVQGCRAFLENCIFVGTPAIDRAERRGSGSGGGDDARHPPAARPLVMGHADSVRSTGLIVELGGTLTARFCTARHLYFAFCVIAHSVAHLYRCHAEDAVNGYTVDASAATLDGCSANTNHVGVFVLRKAKCILTDETGGSFSRRCTELAAAHAQARRTVLAALQAAHLGGRPPPPSAAAVAATTARVAALARQYYAERLCCAEVSTTSRSSSGSGETSTMAALPLPQLLQGATAGSGAAGTPSNVRRSEEEGIGDEDGVMSPHFGFHGGSFSLEVRDAALKARGVTLMNASDTAVYAVDQSTVELEDCVLWSTAEAEDAANAAAVAAEEEATRRRNEARRSSSFSSSSSSSCRSVSLDAAANVIGDAPLQLKAHRLYTRRRASQRCSGAAMAAVGVEEVAAAAAAAAATSAASTKMHPMAASSATPTYRRAVLGPRLSSCGVKTVHSTLTARRCLVTGFGFGVGAIESSTAELTECMAAHGMNGFTVDHSSCHLRDCGADASHVAIFALNGAVVTVEGVPHVVGISSAQRPPPRRICGGLAALFSGDAYGVECKASELHCNGVTVRRGRDSGFNVYNKSTCTLHRCLVDMASGDAAGAEHRGGRAASHTPAAVGGEPWLHHLSLDPHADTVQNAGEGEPAAAAEESGSDAASSSSERDGACRTDAAARPAAGAVGSTPAIATRVSPSPKLGSTAASRGECGGRAPRADSAVLTSGVKVWSGSRCVAQDSEVRSVTFGFAALGPDTTLEAHHCTAKHVVNGFTADGGSMQLTKCSASSNHVGVYVLSHGRCIVRRGSYTAKKYGIECRGGVLSFQGHVKIYGFARIGLYLYAGAHCEADSDSVLDIQAHKQQQHQQQQQQQPSPTPTHAAAVSPCELEEAASVADLLPSCVALDDATAHVPQAVLGGGARCGITCAAGATAFIGQCLVHDCTLVGINVFAGAHLTLSNCQLRCARRYAVVVHVGGVCRITGHDEAPRRTSGGVKANAEERSGASHPSAAAVALPGLRQRLWEAARCAVAAVARRAMPQRWLWWIAGSRFTAAGCSDGRRRSGTTAGASKRPGATTAALLQEALAAYHAAVKGEEAGLSLVNPTSATPASLADGNSDATAVMEEGHCLVLPHDAASHLRWLSCEAHSTALQFRLNPLVSSSPAAAAGVAPEAATDYFSNPPQSAASPSHAATTVAGSGDAAASSLSLSSPPYAPALPPVWPCIVGSCVVRGTCVMERVRLCPTPLPRWPDAGQTPRQSTESGEHGKREEVSDGSSGTSYWSSESPQCDAAAEDCAMEENTAGETADGADDAGDPPALYVTQHGVLHLTDCIVDTSLATHHTHRPARADPSAAAVLLLCDGPYARLHCDYVRALSYGDDDCGGQEGVGVTTTTASGTLRHRTLPGVRSCTAVDDGAGAGSPIPSVSCGGAWADEEGARPRLVLSLRNGAECTLHGLGAALHSWPFSAFAGVAEGWQEGSQAGFRVPSARHRGERDALTNEPEEPAAARADTAGRCDGGFVLRLSNGSVAEASFSAFAKVAASSQSTLRCVRCVVQGEMHPPLRLSRGSRATLLFCRLVRAESADVGASAAAATVAGGARCVLFRTAVQTASQTAAVTCADGGEVVQVRCGAFFAPLTDDRGA